MSARPVDPLSFSSPKKLEVKSDTYVAPGSKALRVYTQVLRLQGSQSPLSLDLSRDLSRSLRLSRDLSCSLCLPLVFREVSDATDGARKLFKLGIDFHLELAVVKCKCQLC